MQVDFYAVLGVPRNATAEQIKERFLQLTREKHPDRFRGAEKQRAELAFQEITQAFNTLSNPERRLVMPIVTQKENVQAPGSVGRLSAGRPGLDERDRKQHEADRRDSGSDGAAEESG